MKARRIGWLVIATMAALPLSAAGPHDEVTQMLQSFYKWYVPHIEHGAKTSDGRMSEYVTDRLRARIARLSKSEKGEVAALDYDPFVNAQDISKDWAKNITVRDVTVKGETAIATVVLGGEFESTVHLQLVRARGKWKIDNFKPKI